MRNKLLVITLITLLICMLVGCGEEGTKGSTIATLEKLESTEAEEAVEESTEETVTQQEDTEDEEFTFADLAELRFEFSSGTGGWSEGFRMERDGYFVGQYSCFDTQDVGEDYPDGTIYSSLRKKKLRQRRHVRNLVEVLQMLFTMTHWQNIP